MKSKKIAVFTAWVLISLVGCHVPLKPYRLSQPVIEVPLSSATSGPAEDTANDPSDKNCVLAKDPVCLAFIEVDDMGELFEKGELDTALDLIQRTNDLARTEPGSPPPIVVTFVHGWKNNASQSNDNVAGFKAALREIYSAVAPHKRVVGIYIGWRGDLIKSYFPVARQFSYYNREATAIRVPGVTLSSALTRIATKTHENPGALAIYIGHSFGGLLLERALSESTASQIAEAEIYSQESCQTDDAKLREDKQLAARLAVDSRADLVIFINPAGAATEAKQMLDFLTFTKSEYRPSVLDTQNCKAQPSVSSDRDLDRPLFVSLTSTADAATKIALPIGHSLPYLGFKSNGSFRDLSQEPGKKYDLACFDPHNSQHQTWTLKTKEEGAAAQGSYYLSSAPHMQILQSHVMLKAVGANEMRVSSTGEKIRIEDSNAIAKCDRELFNKQNLNVISTFRLEDTKACFAIQERPNRCNGTPYWLMEIDPDVVPDHSTIFTQRFIHFVIDSFFVTPEGTPLQRLSPQMTH